MPFPTDPFSTFSHLVGAIACIIAARPLLRRATTPVRRRALGIFAGSAITLLLASTLFHAMPAGTASRTITQRLDHAAIFLLIAGSFTPIHVILFTGLARWGVLCLLWLAALAGVVAKSIFFSSVPEQAGIAAYLILGWSGGISILIILLHRGLRFVSPLLLGGIAYTAGALCEFTSLPVPIPGLIGSHEVFHLAVLLGLGSMWLFMHRIADTPEIGSPPTLRPPPPRAGEVPARLGVAGGAGSSSPGSLAEPKPDPALTAH